MAAAASARADIHDNLVVHLTFDGDVLDHSGNGNDGAIVRAGAGSPFVPAIIRQGFQTTGLPAGYRAMGERRYDCPLVGAGLDDNQWHHYVVAFTRQSDVAIRRY
jgi:hypothetical protein